MKNQIFNGFSNDTLKFLKSLRENNSKSWFEDNRDDYKKYLLELMQNLVMDLSDIMLDIDFDFEVAPKIDKTISRIYRDIRFSKNKSPYRSNMWIVFKRPQKEWKESPGFFFEIFEDWYRYGMGFYTATKNTMDNMREFIDENPDEFLKLVSPFMKKKQFELEGDQYKRIMDETQPKEIQTWYQRRNLYLVCNKKIDDTLFSNKLVEELYKGFKLLAPFYHFLWEMKGGG